MKPICAQCFVAIAFGAAIAIQPALAEQADRSLPIEIRAVDITIDQNNRTYELRGNATHPRTMRLVADRMLVKEDSGGNRSALFGANRKARYVWTKERPADYMEGFADRADLTMPQTYCNSFQRPPQEWPRTNSGRVHLHNQPPKCFKASARIPGARQSQRKQARMSIFH